MNDRRRSEPLAEFYEIYAASIQRVGSPPFPRRLVEAIRKHFGRAAQLLTIWHEGRMVSGVISFFYEDQVMRGACLAGYRVFDGSRSRRGSGSYDFRKRPPLPVTKWVGPTLTR